MTDCRCKASLHTMRAALGDREGVRHAVFEGKDHLVVPVVMLVEGVLNGALVPFEEFSQHTQDWNNRPVPVRHPQRDGVFTSANDPEVLQQLVIGSMFGVYADNGKLKGEAWIDVEKARRLGYGQLVDQLEAGELVEVSTGYVSDLEEVQGTHNGEPYSGIHRNIRPDHLALLPDEEGACSARDGCGTRVNSSKERAGNMTTRLMEALKTMAGAAGLRVHVEETDMPNAILQKAEELKTNEKLTAKQYEMVSGMDEEQLAMLSSLVEAMASAGVANKDPEEYDNEGNEEVGIQMEANSKVPTEEEINRLVANRVDEAVRRREAVAKLKTNERSPFSESELAEMSVNHLEKLASSLQAEDYSGAGGFAANGSGVEAADPLTINRGVLSRTKKEQ